MNYLSTKTEVAQNVLGEVMDRGEGLAEGCYYGRRGQGSAFLAIRGSGGRTFLGRRFKV